MSIILFDNCCCLPNQVIPETDRFPKGPAIEKTNWDLQFQSRGLKFSIEYFNPRVSIYGSLVVSRSKILIHDRSLEIFNPKGHDQIFSIPGPSGSLSAGNSLINSLRAQRLKNFKILKFSSGIEICKRAIQQTPISWGGILKVEIGNFERDWSFQARLIFFNLWALRV